MLPIFIAIRQIGVSNKTFLRNLDVKSWKMFNDAQRNLWAISQLQINKHNEMGILY